MLVKANPEINDRMLLLIGHVGWTMLRWNKSAGGHLAREYRKFP